MSRKKLLDVGSRSINGLEATNCEDKRSKMQCLFGDIIWIKIRDSSWWPVQVVDEENVINKPKKKKDKVLARIYGTYDYLYVDPMQSISEFNNLLRKEKTSPRELFQKTLEEDISQSKSAGKKRKKSKFKENDTTGTPKGKRQKQDKIVMDLEADDLATAKSGAPNADLSARRLRVMRNLGLIAPLGSPFSKNELVGSVTE